MVAMTAARSGEPERAIDGLLLDIPDRGWPQRRASELVFRPLDRSGYAAPVRIRCAVQPKPTMATNVASKFVP